MNGLFHSFEIDIFIISFRFKSSFWSIIYNIQYEYWICDFFLLEYGTSFQIFSVQIYPNDVWRSNMKNLWYNVFDFVHWLENNFYKNVVRFKSYEVTFNYKIFNRIAFELHSVETFWTYFYDTTKKGFLIGSYLFNKVCTWNFCCKCFAWIKI